MRQSSRGKGGVNLKRARSYRTSRIRLRAAVWLLAALVLPTSLAGAETPEISPCVRVISLQGAPTSPVTVPDCRVVQLTAEYRLQRIQLAAGVDPTFVVGALFENGFRFPTTLMGLSPFMGFDYRGFFNVPADTKVSKVAAYLAAEHPAWDLDQLREAVRQAVHPGAFQYFEVGTEALVVPKVGVGILWPLSRGPRNAIFVDTGVNLPLGLNVGVIVAF